MGTTALLLGAALAFQSPTTLDTLFTLGTIGGPEEQGFARVVDAVFAPDGTLFIIDTAPPHVRVFDPNGDFVRMFGRRGRGPGELIRPTNAMWLDSTLVVRHSGAVTQFASDGDFVQLWRPPISGRAQALVPGEDDEYVVLKQGVNRRSGVDRPQELFLVDGPEVERLAIGVSGTVFHRGAGSHGALVTGICGTMSLSYLGEGAFLLGDGRRGEIVLYRGTSPVRTVDVAPEAGEVPEAVVDQVWDLWALTSAGRRGEERQFFVPPVFSSVCHVQAESAERAWFRRNGFRDDPEEWQAVDLETGELALSFRLEPGMRIQSIRAGRAAAVWNDDLGVSYVTVLALPGG